MSVRPLSHALPLSLSSIYPFVRTPEYLTVHRETAREPAPLCQPTCSICKPPRNESVNPVTSFAAILVLRRLGTRAIFRQILRAGLVSNANPRSRALLGDRVNANSYAAQAPRRDYRRGIISLYSSERRLCTSHSRVQKCESNGALQEVRSRRVRNTYRVTVYAGVSTAASDFSSEK